MSSSSRDARRVPELGLNGHIGVNTGEVVTGTEERLATGDAVNVAARLEQAAAPGEVLIGTRTLALVASAVDVEAVDPLTLKGKSKPVAAYRLLAAAGMPERRFSTPMIGRERGATTGPRRLCAGSTGPFVSCCLRCSVLPVSASRGSRRSSLRARKRASCVAAVSHTARGITYSPVVEILKQGTTLPDGDAATPLRALLGEGDHVASAREIAWGFRKLLEQEARAQAGRLCAR